MAGTPIELDPADADYQQSRIPPVSKSIITNLPADLTEAEKIDIRNKLGLYVLTPTISEFTLQGDLDPVAGSIQGKTYRFSTAISNFYNVGAARIIGVAPNNAVTVLKTYAAGEYAHASGSVTLPAVTLADGQSYTLRFQVYGTGQKVGTATPLAQQDRLITAHMAEIAPYHVGYLVVNSSDANVVATLARLTGFTNDTDTGTHLPFELEINVPSDSNYYHIYLLAKQDQLQPTAFTSAGLPATNSFYPAQDKLLGGVLYSAYVLKPLFAVTSSNNGQTYGVTA